MKKLVLILTVSMMSNLSWQELGATRQYDGGVSELYPAPKSVQIPRRNVRAFPYPRRIQPPLYNPYFELDGTPIYDDYTQPCHFDAYSGQWIGPCDSSLTTPGYSTTVPNRIRR